MGSPYSQDLRIRVLASLGGGMSKMAAHKTFGVSRSTIDDWVKLHEATGSLQPKARGPRLTKRAIPDLALFEAFARRHSALTLSQMKRAWKEEHGQELSEMTFSVMLRRIGWTRKKRVGFTRNETNKNAAPISNS